MTNRKEIVHELFELRVKLLNATEEKDIKELNEKIQLVRKEIFKISREEVMKKRGR